MIMSTMPIPYMLHILVYQQTTKNLGTIKIDWLTFATEISVNTTVAACYEKKSADKATKIPSLG